MLYSTCTLEINKNKQCAVMESDLMYNKLENLLSLGWLQPSYWPPLPLIVISQQRQLMVEHSGVVQVHEQLWQSHSVPGLHRDGDEQSEHCVQLFCEQSSQHDAQVEQSKQLSHWLSLRQLQLSLSGQQQSSRLEQDGIGPQQEHA